MILAVAYGDFSDGTARRTALCGMISCIRHLFLSNMFNVSRRKAIFTGGNEAGLW